MFYIPFVVLLIAVMVSFFVFANKRTVLSAVFTMFFAGMFFGFFIGGLTVKLAS